MRVLIIRNYPSYMDVEKRTYNVQEVGLAKALVRAGCQCDILFWTAEEEKDVHIPVGDHGITVFYRNAVSILKNAIYTRCSDLFDRYDILQTAEYNQFQSLWMALKYPEKHLVYHGPYYCAFNRNYNRFCAVFDRLFLWIYKWRKTVFITKSNLASAYLKGKGICEDYINPIGVGIDETALFAPVCGEEKDFPFISQLKCDACIKLLYIGKIEPRRNILFLLHLLKAVVQEGIPARLYMIGEGEEAYVECVRELIRRQKLEKYIVWEDKMEQKYLHQVYQASDVFLLPSIYEIFGMVLLEAMYFGTLVLTTQNGGADTLIQHGINGYILDDDRMEDWVEIIRKYSQNRSDFETMKEKAAATIRNHFTWDCISEQFLEVYGAMAQNSNK